MFENIESKDARSAGAVVDYDHIYSDIGSGIFGGKAAGLDRTNFDKRASLCSVYSASVPTPTLDMFRDLGKATTAEWIGGVIGGIAGITALGVVEGYGQACRGWAPGKLRSFNYVSLVIGAWGGASLGRYIDYHLLHNNQNYYDTRDQANLSRPGVLKTLFLT